ncbi:plasmid mobilization relaxosome protein MobC [Chitinophaga varians]|uniref:plasmid mobilization protein n=1 Tax=Chitinophaga varians TaxID=2202339 RepID=UPI00165FE663|nr:plasmid mobilization relaxosome protein MobC [Chitinophaga varians]MBC9909109.1 plasmid mobilization relaxosome protein MobC [Chitinophaga varians]
MPRRKTPEERALVYRIETRVTAAKFRELQDLLRRSCHREMSGLLRDILHNRTIRTYVHDHHLDMEMEELAAIRGEIKSIGVNINQITRLFNTYPEPKRKAFYAKVAFSEYLRIEGKIDHLLTIISKIAGRWLLK